MLLLINQGLMVCLWEAYLDPCQISKTELITKIVNTVMQIEKALINDRSSVSKVSWKFCIRTICNFAVIYPWNLLLSWKVAYFLTVSIVFSFYKQNVSAQ